MAKAQYTYSKDVENRIAKGIRGGVSIKRILAGMQDLQQAPRNTATLYKLYGQFIEDLRADIDAKIGGKVIEQALDGDFKSQELYLRAKAGWSPQKTVNEVEQDGDPDEDDGAIDILMAKLGKSRQPQEEE